MKSLLVIGNKEIEQFKLLSALRSSYEIQIEDTCPDQTNAEAVLVWDCKKDQFENLLSKSPSIKWVHTRMAGVEGIVGEKLKSSSIVLTNAQGVYADCLAEFVIFGMLYFAKFTNRMNAQKKDKSWTHFEVDCLKGTKLGILGYGAIGQQIARLAVPFGMEVIAFRTKVKPEGEKQNGVMVYPVSRFDEFVSEFDYLANAMPGTPETINFLNKERLSKLKSSSVLVNVGRGSAIDEPTMISMLEQNEIRGAVLDVFATEPLPANNKLWELPNVFVSPHTADRTATWLDDTMNKFIENANLYAQAKPLTNVVDKLRGY